jgi:methyltransferase (TIGR00027 family)
MLTNGKPFQPASSPPAQSGELAPPQVAPSALRVALRRAAHQLVDSHPLVFPDPFAIPILGAAHARALARTPTRPHRTWSFALRAFAVARSRYLQDQLDKERHLQHVVLLGAGLDTTAWRNTQLHVWELDRAATLTWKQQLATAASLSVPPRQHYVPLDLADPGTGLLASAGLPPNRPTLFALLGVVPYLPPGTLEQMLPLVEAQGRGSGILFDYRLPRAALPPEEQRQHDSLTARITAAGEPFQTFFTPASLATVLSGAPFTRLYDLDTDALNRLYFQQSGALRTMGHATRLAAAWL